MNPNCFSIIKNASSHREKKRQQSCSSHLFPAGNRTDTGLELAPARPRRRLPWYHRASPSTTRNEFVISTNADRLMHRVSAVNAYFFVRDLSKGGETA